MPPTSLLRPDWIKRANKLTLVQISDLQQNQIKRKTKRLLQIREELKEINEDLKQALAENPQYLKTLPGCGRTLAAGILAEVRDISRFPSKDALAKYAGLSPRPWGVVKH